MDLDAKEIETTLERVHEGRLVEIRILDKKQIVSGYYLDYRKAAQDILEYDTKRQPDGIYMTLQEIHPGLIARAPDQLVTNPAQTTSDRDVIGYRWMLIDIDPVRPAGISASGAELAAAGEVYDRLLKFNCEIAAFSGNGYHMLCKRNVPYGVVQLRDWAASYESDKAKVDLSTWKPSQITKVYGTWARKGFEVGGRVWRRSYIID